MSLLAKLCHVCPHFDLFSMKCEKEYMTVDCSFDKFSNKLILSVEEKILQRETPIGTGPSNNHSDWLMK